MWTNSVPAEPGFYWYRESLTLAAQVVELDEIGRWTQTDHEGDMFGGGFGLASGEMPGGLFWSERLIAPPVNSMRI
jgi:hypothetical protein